VSTISVFSKAVTNLTVNNVFFTAMLYNLKHEFSDKVPTAGTDGVRLLINPEWFEALKVDDAVFVLAHELGHVMLFHSLRRGARDPMLWNIAADYVVNLMLVEHRFPRPAIMDIYDTKYSGWTTEKVYDDLVQNPPPQGTKNKLAGDVMDYKPGENDNKAASDVERELGVALEKALQAAKAAGTLTVAQREALRAAQVIKEPWFSHLQRFITTLNAREYNWARTDQRRLSYMGVISPEMRSEVMGKVVVSIDESGSLQNEQLAAIAAHVNDLCRSCSPRELVVIRHTNEVTHEQTYTGPDYIDVLERKSSGGTDFRPVFERISELHSDAQVTLMFTDMYGPTPDSFAGEVLWVTSSTGMNAPFGDIINADFND
jgi:predicted metal-dependent peptidase